MTTRGFNSQRTLEIPCAGHLHEVSSPSTICAAISMYVTTLSGRALDSLALSSGCVAGSSTRGPLQRYGAAAIVLVLHLAVLWAVAMGIRPSTRADVSRDLEIALLSPNLGPKVAPAPPLDWDFQAPEAVLVPEPEITIDRTLEGQIVGTPVVQKFPPRIDPAHVNARPELPTTFGSLVAALSLELRILVLPDGSVGGGRANRPVLRPGGNRPVGYSDGQGQLALSSRLD
jgi:hypothetical protein